MRADARRNHDRLLAEARVAFAKSGADASLEEIAHRAGVGSGTLYRHFPTREALLEAVIRDWTESMQAEAESYIDRGAPAEALHAWLRAYITHATVFRGLAAALMAGMQEKTSALYSCGQTVKAASAELLARAQASGEIRIDADISDILKLAKGIALAAEQTGGGDELIDRLLALVMDGLRVQTRI
jgi:AcrR family transcriptional regulator